MADKYRWNSDSPLSRSKGNAERGKKADRAILRKGEIFEPSAAEIASFGDLMTKVEPEAKGDEKPKAKGDEKK